MPSEKDIVREARESLPRLFAKPGDLETIARAPELLRALADEVERLRKERNIAVRFLSKQGYERCANHCDSWHQKGESYVSV